MLSTTGLLLVLVLSTPALASESLEEQANALFNQAKAKIAQGDCGRAIEDLTKAWALFSHPLIIKKRASCHEDLGMLKEAIRDYTAFRETLPTTSTKRSETSEKIAALEKLRKEPVTVTVTSLRTGVLVSVEERKPQRTPFDVALVPGVVTLTVRDHRFLKTKELKRVLATKGQVFEVEVEANLGTVVVESAAGTLVGVDVSIDKRRLRLSVYEQNQQRTKPRELSVGEHVLLCRVPGERSVPVPFSVAADRVMTVQCRTALSRAWFWSALIGGGLGVAAGTGYWVSYALDLSEAERTNKRLITSKHIAGGVSLGLGLALTGLSYFVYDDTAVEPLESTALVTPFLMVPSSDIGGLLMGVSGRF